MNQVKTQAEFLKNVDADLVLEQVIYSKVLEALMDPRNLDLKSVINLQMGSFHASCIFIAVIGERFGEAGLKDLCIEGTMIGPGSINSTMKGKKTNRAIRILKIVYESLQRLKLDAFEKWSQRTNKQPVTEISESIAMNNLMQTRNSSNCFLKLTAVEGLFDLYQ